MSDQKHRHKLSPSDERLWSVTGRALEAAERGDWPSVQSCYEERGSLLGFTPASPALAERLLAVDASIAEKIGLAKAAIGQLLSDTATIRRQLARMVEPREAPNRVGTTLDRQS